MPHSAPFRFAEVAPDPQLRPWLRACWEFEVAEGAPATHHVPPDGCPVLVKGHCHGGEPLLLVFGPRTEPLVVPATAGQRQVGLRFAPGATLPLFGLDPGELVNSMRPLPAGGRIVPAALLDALAVPDLTAMAEAVDGLLLPLVPSLQTPDPLVVAGLARIWEGGGREPLPQVAAALGCSPRTLLRRIRGATGLTPKQYVRITRFMMTARGMLGDDIRISHLAASGGYADQPHFHHEVSSLTGLTPSELAARVRSTEHRLAE